MHEIDVLGLAHRSDFSDLALFQQFLDLAEERGVSQDVAHEDLVAVFLGDALDLHAVGIGSRNGFFQQYIVSQRERASRVTDVKFIHRRDHARFSSATLEKLFFRSKTLLVGEVVLLFRAVHRLGTHVAHGGDLHSVGFIEEIGVHAAAVAVS